MTVAAMPRYGSHLSIAGGLVNALTEAESLGLDCVQVFTKNQRQWKAPALTEQEQHAWLAELASMRWRPSDGDGDRVVSHNSYLINLASADPEIRRKSIALERIEMERCEALEIPLLVTHPGAHLGTPPPRGPLDLEADPSPDEAAGIQRIADALNMLHGELPGYRTITCLETTAGTGTNLGYAFHHLARIRGLVREPDRVAFCLDTCHVTAAGYDMTTDDRAAAVLARFDDVCGLDALRAVHVNDSVFGVGSRKDRHEHIGDGACGRSCFRAILNHPALALVPLILETPKGEDESGRSWDHVNVGRLKRMIRPRQPSR